MASFFRPDYSLNSTLLKSLENKSTDDSKLSNLTNPVLNSSQLELQGFLEKLIKTTIPPEIFTKIATDVILASASDFSKMQPASSQLELQGGTLEKFAKEVTKKLSDIAVEKTVEKVIEEVVTPILTSASPQPQSTSPQLELQGGLLEKLVKVIADKTIETAAPILASASPQPQPTTPQLELQGGTFEKLTKEVTKKLSDVAVGVAAEKAVEMIIPLLASTYPQPQPTSSQLELQGGWLQKAAKIIVDKAIETATPILASASPQPQLTSSQLELQGGWLEKITKEATKNAIFNCFGF